MAEKQVGVVAVRAFRLTQPDCMHLLQITADSMDLSCIDFLIQKKE